MALSTAEKAKISRQFDFLTDPADAGQRQLVYDRLGLKSFEVAEAEAELRRTTKQGELSALGRQFGAPKQTTLGQEFTLPDTSRRTFSEGGDLRSIELPPFYTNEYSPFDQKKLERLYTSRSEFATDPELTDQERQGAFDAIDAKISAVPRISPMMKEPTAQQKYEASIVTDPVTGQRGIVGKDGKLNPLIDPKIQQAEQDAYNTRYYKNLDALRKTNDDPLNLNQKREYPDLVDEARSMTDIEMGRTKGRRDSNMPELDEAWTTTMSDLQVDNKFADKRASEAQMLRAMDQYIAMAVDRGARDIDAKADFLQRWQAAIGGGPHFNLVPKMSATTRNKAQVAMAGTIRQDDAISRQYGLRRGEGKVTVQEQELPPEIDAIWGSLSNSDKKAIRESLASGANNMLPMEKRQIPVRNAQGQEGTIPLVELGEALEAGFTVVN